MNLEQKNKGFEGIDSIDEKTAILLYDNGFMSIDDLKNISIDDLKKVKGLKKKAAKKIIEEISKKIVG